MVPPDALQVLPLAHAEGAEAGDYPRIKDYFEEIRIAFVGSDSNYLVRELGLLDEKGTGADVQVDPSLTKIRSLSTRTSNAGAHCLHDAPTDHRPRAARQSAAGRADYKEDETEADANIIDRVTDLCHLARRRNCDAETILRLALMHFE